MVVGVEVTNVMWVSDHSKSHNWGNIKGHISHVKNGLQKGKQGHLLGGNPSSPGKSKWWLEWSPRRDILEVGQVGFAWLGCSG